MKDEPELEDFCEDVIADFLARGRERGLESLYADIARQMRQCLAEKGHTRRDSKSG